MRPVVPAYRFRCYGSASMQAVASHTETESSVPRKGPPPSELAQAARAFEVIRRNGAIVPFNADKIALAMTKAFLAVEGGQGGASARVRDLVARLTSAVVQALTRRLPGGGTVHIEDIQDQVELALMREGCHDVARAYVLYRERRAAERAAEAAAGGGQAAVEPLLHAVDGDHRIALERAVLR